MYSPPRISQSRAEVLMGRLGPWYTSCAPSLRTGAGRRQSTIRNSSAFDGAPASGLALPAWLGALGGALPQPAASRIAITAASLPLIPAILSPFMNAETVVEGRHGCAGVPRALGGWGGARS